MSDVIIPYRFLVRAGTAAAVAALNEIPRARELIYETDTLKYKLGDGVTHYNDLAYVGESGGSSPSLQYTADTGSTADSDPGNGLLKWNNATQGSATVIYLDDLTSDGTSVLAIWPELHAGGFMYLQHATDPDTFQIWEVTGIVDATGYVKLTSTILANGGSFADGDPMLVTLQNGPTFSAGVTAGSATAGPWVIYNGTVQAAGKWDGGTTAPVHTTRLNYDGYFYATKFFGDGSALTGISEAAVDLDVVPNIIQGLLGRTSWAFQVPQPNATSTTTIGYNASDSVGIGTVSAAAITATNAFTRQVRRHFASSSSAGSSSGSYHSVGYSCIDGGFQLIDRFGSGDAATVANARSFVGFRLSTAAPANTNPSTWTDIIGFCHDSGDANLSTICSNTAGPATKTTLGSSFPANTLSTDFYEIQLLCVPGSGVVQWSIKNISSGASASGTFTSNLPATSALLCRTEWRNNGSTALAVRLDLGGWSWQMNRDGF